MIFLIDSFRFSKSFRLHKSFIRRQDSRFPVNSVSFSNAPTAERGYKRDSAQNPRIINNQEGNRSRRVYIPKISSSYTDNSNTISSQSYFHYFSSHGEGKIRAFSDRIDPRFKFPTGDERDTRLPEDQADMELNFLGTASCIPTVTRGVNSIALRYGSNIHLFDCGEATQIQFQKSRLKLSAVNKIFITHLHGDHSFGLPGFLCYLGSSFLQEGFTTNQVVDIYGPEGIRHYLRSVLQLTQSRITAPHRIHELKNIPFLHSQYQRFTPFPEGKITTSPDPAYGERPGGLDLYPDEDGIYHIPPTAEEERTSSKQVRPLIYKAAPMQHSIPCVGYVATEPTPPGRLRFEELKKVIEPLKNELIQMYPELKEGWGKIYGKLKDLEPSEYLTLPNGVRLKGEDVNDPPKEGRRIVIMGDTCNGNLIKPIAMNATVLVHEATNSFFPEFDRQKFAGYYELEKATYIHGHSTPQMAGRFAQSINAKQLILTHFSSRYTGDSLPESMMTMWRMEDMARMVYPKLKRPNDVIAAWDLMKLQLYASQDMISSSDKESQLNEKDATDDKSSSSSSESESAASEESRESESIPVPLIESKESFNTTNTVTEVAVTQPAKRGRKKKVVIEEN